MIHGSHSRPVVIKRAISSKKDSTMMLAVYMADSGHIYSYDSVQEDATHPPLQDISRLYSSNYQMSSKKSFE